ncbi:hypothetical protein C0J52_08046 [Blattella germanica]|nr:hypothetical protein C0J52_08046 [Blattella germanica]
MARGSDISFPLRLTGYFGFDSECELTFLVEREDDLALTRRLDHKTYLLTRNYTWRNLQNTLEQEAISTISVKEHLSKLYNIAKELSGISSESVDRSAVLLLHLFLQESLASTLLKGIMKHVFGFDVSSIILHRIYKIVHELKNSLPSYTLEHFLMENKCQGRRNGMFGGDICFVYLDRNTVVNSNTTVLCDIKLSEENKFDIEELEGTDDLSDDSSDTAPSSLTDLHPFNKMMCYRFDDDDHEEVRFQLIPKYLYKFDFCIPVSELNEVLYLVPSIETAEYMALQLKRYLKPIQINVAHFTNSAELNYIKVNAVQVIVTTASLWEMKGKLASGLDVRIMGFTISLLSVHCGPSFCDLAEYLQVDKNNALILSEYYMPMLPYVSVIKMKQSHYEKCQKYIAYICESAITGENKKKVVVFVKNKDDVFEIAKSIQNSLDTFQSKFLTLPDSVMVNLMNLMKAQGTDNVSMFLCLQGYLTLHAELSEHVRNYLYMIFKMGLAKIMVATSNYAPMLSDQADTVIVKDIDFYNKKKNPSTHEISSVVQMLAVAITSKKCRRNVIFIVDTEKFDTYQSILQNQSDVKSQLLYVIPDVLNNEIVANNVIDVTDCEKWFRHTFLFYNMLKKSKLLHIFDNLDAEVHHLMSEVLKALEECEMIKYPWKGHFIATDLNNVAHCHQVSYITLAFIGKYAETFLDENSIIDILCNAPVFSSFVVRMAAAQDNEFSTLADNFSIKKCGNWEIITLLKSSLCGIVSPRLETDQIYIIQEFKRLIRIMFEMYLTKKNAVMAERCMQLACTVEKCWRKANNIPEKFPTLIFEGCPQLISKVVLKVNFLIRPNSSWKMEVNDSRHLFWLWVVDVRNNIIQNYTCVELTQNIIEEEKNLIVSLPMKVTKPFRSQCKAYLLSCKSWEWVFTCTIPFHQIILPNDTPSYTELLKLHRLPVSVLQNYVLEKQFSSLLFSPFITQAFHSLYHSDCNVLLTCTVEDLITAAEIAVFRALSRNPGAKVSLIVVNDLHLLDADMEAALLRILASPQHKLVRVLGLSPTSIACSDDIIRFLRISPESPSRVYNFGHYTDSMMLNKVEVLGFSLRDFSTRSRAMSLSVWDIIQNVQTDERVIVLVPSREEVLATGMALKKFISDSLNPDICKCWEDNVEDMMFETQDINVSDLLKLGIGLLESGMSDYDCNIIHTIWQLRMIRVSPLLLESQLPGVLVDHINSEIAEGVINTKESAARYLQHSFFAHRVTSNPCFYHMGEMYKQKPEKYLIILVNKSLLMLEEVGCIIIKDSDKLQPTMLGLLKLKNQCRWPVDLPDSSPLVEKVFILIQSHFSKSEKVFPNSVDYESDLKEIVDIALKIVQIGEALRKLPKINFGIEVCRDKKRWKIKSINSHSCNTNLVLYAGIEYILAVELQEAENELKNSWTLIFGSREKKEVLAMQRVKCGTKKSLMKFKTPEEAGEVTYTLFLLPNNYIGIDQLCNVYLEIVCK